LIASTLTLAPSIWGTRDKKSSSSPFAMFVRASLAKSIRLSGAEAHQKRVRCHVRDRFSPDDEA
jgi:hypothetical protein